MMRILRRWFKKPRSGSVAGKYSHLELNDHEIANGAYKQHLGGGEQEWDSRGKFQLSFLISQGMRPESRLLDVGCGPLRAGVHFISYLDKGNYYGVDYNPSFIKVATRLAEEKTLRTLPDLENYLGFRFFPARSTVQVHNRFFRLESLQRDTTSIIFCEFGDLPWTLIKDHCEPRRVAPQKASRKWGPSRDRKIRSIRSRPDKTRLA